MANEDRKDDRIVRIDEVTKMTGLGRTTIWRRTRDGDFPRSRRLGGSKTRAVGWLRTDLQAWIDSRPPTR